MLNGIFYFCTFMILSVLITMVKVNGNKIDFLRNYIISIWTTLIIGAILGLFMDLVGVPICLTSISVGFAICAVALLIYFVTGKERVQKFSFDWRMLLTIVISLVICVYVFLVVFGTEFALSYGCTDAGRHFKFAKDIFETHQLNRMYFAAMYNSLFMEIFKDILQIEEMYKPFMISDAIFNMLNMITFYAVASGFVKTKFTKNALYFVTIFYFFGWPVFSWTSGGFVYCGIGVSLFMYGMHLLQEFDKCEEKKYKHKYIVLITLSIYGLTQCYFLFIPIYLLSIFAYLAYKHREKLKDIQFKTLIKWSLIGIIVIGLIAIVIFFGFFKGQIFDMAMALLIDGALHKEFYRDFVFLLPVNIYMCVKKYKENKVDTLFIFNVAYLSFMLLVLVQNVCGILSDYYFYKFYFIGWTIQLIGLVEAIEHFWKEKKDVIYYCFIPIAVVIVLEVTGLGTKITGTGEEEMLLLPIIQEGFGDIDILKDIDYEQKKSMMELVEWANDNLDASEIPVICGHDEVFHTWHQAMLEGVVLYTSDEQNIKDEEMFDVFMELLVNEIEYFTVAYHIPAYTMYTHIYDMYECVYTNDYYKIYKIDL